MPKLPRKTKKQKERAHEILNELYKYYPNPECDLIIAIRLNY